MSELRVVRHGTAIADGERLVRRIDLAPHLGDPTPRAPGFSTASRRGDRIEIEMTDGSRDTVPASVLGPPRKPNLVIVGGPVMTSNGDADDRLGVIADGAIVCGGGRILWVGPRAELTATGLSLSGSDHIDSQGRLVTPGLVDCHAHPIFAGNRADEFARRAAGQNYREIAAAGGGIASTVRATRATGFEEHVELAFARMARAFAAGTTTCEAKSGYDLTVDGELRLLEIALTVDSLSPVDLVPTLLGAHALPPERADDRAGFVADVVERMIPAAASRSLAHAVDVYCDTGAFTLEETREILTAARDAGLVVRAHAGQFADLRAPQLVAELGGTSADHLEVISEAGISAMAHGGVVGVMLPGACVQLRMQPPPVSALRAAGVAMAIATDMNPGTSMGETLPLQMWLATTHYQMTVEEAWLGVTAHAARALARPDIGLLVPGAQADLVIWEAESPAEIPYRYDVHLARTVVKAGRVHSLAI
jgi:imidazolonepropionase